MAVVTVVAKPCGICGGSGIYQERRGVDVYEEGECDCVVSPEFQGDLFCYVTWPQSHLESFEPF